MHKILINHSRTQAYFLNCVSIYHHHPFYSAKLPPFRSRDNPRAPRRRRESMGQPATGKGRRKWCNQSTPISPRRSQSPDMNASQCQMPSTPPEQTAQPAVGNASSVVKTEAVGPTISFLAPDSFSRDGGELHFASYPQQQLSYHDSLGAQ